MDKKAIVAAVKSLGLPTGSFIVFGSCPMAAAGIRLAGDIDMLVTPEVFAKLENEGWEELDKGGNDKPLTKGVFEAHHTWNFSSYQPTLAQLLATADIVDDIPFATLEEVKKWKLSSGRPKDLADIALIEDYQARSTN